jgi:hypothetical protein
VPDLTTSYMGLPLASPLVPSASPLAYDLDAIRRMEDAGAAAPASSPPCSRSSSLTSSTSSTSS